MTANRDQIVQKPIDLHGIVQNIRKESDLSQADVAARLGIAPGSYSEFERNIPQGSVSRFFKLLKALDVELVIRKKIADTKD